MSWEAYSLDQRARKLVTKRSEGCLREAYKMREAVAYGLERFWGESSRYRANQKRYEEDRKQDKANIEKVKADYWEDVWNVLVDLTKEDIDLPLHKDVKVEEDELWKLSRDKQEVALAVLIQLCDCLVWWTQRYK
ncbi:hypothetical protein [Nostoc sp. 'Peltigera membranacea cyanobiont' N6]|uniref:hypothetical protein n=1 Tax=Nostoc sp. 'Peltigera membranacea cyanobiont' N6 TaxID=1261031 RepID=UPI000CF3292F|nr:hypothetical protein [Nostoc sp. 'Peltigera membranacea cyanobiont' N6]AVH68231.1 hypothetical protein NPM_10154 [Nostoc sp. 'Peltigera membranacea cyanobiont' N6]